jgi:hypothetical protein
MVPEVRCAMNNQNRVMCAEKEKSKDQQMARQKAGREGANFWGFGMESYIYVVLSLFELPWSIPLTGKKVFVFLKLWAFTEILPN